MLSEPQPGLAQTPDPEKLRGSTEFWAKSLDAAVADHVRSGACRAGRAPDPRTGGLHTLWGGGVG